jgi:hypothetical protein
MAHDAFSYTYVYIIDLCTLSVLEYYVLIILPMARTPSAYGLSG